MEPLLEPEEVVELGVGEHTPQVHGEVQRADPVDTSVALHEAHRVPRQVVVDDVAGLLEVHAFGEHVGRHHDVEAVLVAALGCVRGARREAPQHLLLLGASPRAGDCGDAAPVRSEPGVVVDDVGQVGNDPVDGVGVVATGSGRPHTFNHRPIRRVTLGSRPRFRLLNDKAQSAGNRS